MFYYSETKYLYEAMTDHIKMGIKGFVKITFRGEKGTIQIHLDDRKGEQKESVKLRLYMLKGQKGIREILYKETELKGGRQQLNCVLEEKCSKEHDCWFGCVILDGGKQFTEKSEYTEELLKKANQKNVSPQNLETEIHESEVNKSEVKEHVIVSDNQAKEEPKSESKEDNHAEIESEEYENTEDAVLPEQMYEEEKKDKYATEQKEKLWGNIYITDLLKIVEINEHWRKYVQNSFLLHGFYNYKHLIATDKLLGVPGNYYDREKQVAELFGFESFLTVKELQGFLLGEKEFVERRISPGTFGYYLCQFD